MEVKNNKEEWIPLHGTYSLEIQLTTRNNAALYIFHKGSNEIGQYTDVPPLQLTPHKQVSKTIKKYLDPENTYQPHALEKNFDDIKLILHETYKILELQQEEEQRIQAQLNEKELEEKLNEAEEKLKTIPNFYIYIASLIDWQTAGERANILLATTAYCSQTLLHNPISVVGLGESSSGKTHIQQIGLSFQPQNRIVYEKKITEAALFNRSREDPYFYDGKIVNYGDMGGEKDLEFAEESKALMKELQSEGFLEKPLSVPDGKGGWMVQTLTLYGKPALTYTTIPGYKFDDQDKSRSIFITPRLDNREVYNARSTMLEFKGKTYMMMKKYKEEAELIPFMIEHIRRELIGVEIINPYVSIIIKFLGDSPNYKRDFSKYNNLLKVITALNYTNHEIHIINEKRVIYSTINDVKLFLSLMKPYHESINANISFKAAEVLKDLRENIDDYIDRTGKYDDPQSRLYEDDRAGITTTEYFELSNCNFPKRSMHRYFGELNEAGFIKVVNTEGKSNVWNLTNKFNESEITDLLTLSEMDKKIMILENGEEMAEIICNDELNPDLSIWSQDKNIMVPSWLKLDH